MQDRWRRRGYGIPSHSFRGRPIIGSPWAYDHGFEMKSPEPSQIVRKAVQDRLIHVRDRVLDLGCGKNPRNTIYLANNIQCQVDGVDLEPHELPPHIPHRVRERMAFHQSSVLDFDYPQDTYKAVIMARLIQYVSPENLVQLMAKVREASLPEAALVLSYTAEGGILDKKDEYAIETFVHPITEVEALLRNSGYNIVSLKPGETQSTNVPHAGKPAVTYDIMARLRDRTGSQPLLF